MEELIQHIREKIAALNIRSFWDVFIGDKVVWTLYFMLAATSLIAVYSSSSMVIFHGGQNHAWSVLLKQIAYLIVGTGFAVGTAWLVYLLKPRVLRKYAYVLYGFSVLLLLLTFSRAFAVEINGATRWVNLFGISIQPSEVAKMTLVLCISKVIAKNVNNLGDFRKVLCLILIFTGIFAILIMRSNLSSALFIVFIMVFMIYVGRLPWKQLLYLGGGGLFLAFILGFVILKTPDIFPRGETWQKRIVSFMPSLAPYSSNYNPETNYMPIDNHQVTQAKIAIAEGYKGGKFPGNSTQRYKLSQAYCDFIFAIIVEETGWLGAIWILGIYLVFTVRAFILMKKTERIFDSLVIVGLLFIIVSQAFLHIGVVVNVLPATGQTLPIVSSGGSSLIITCIELGIVLGISKYNQDGLYSKEVESVKTKQNV